MAATTDNDKLISDAWARWRKADFTWDGLSRKEWRKGWGVIRRDSREYLVEIETGRLYGQAKIAQNEIPAISPIRTATLQDYWRADFVTGVLRSDAEMGLEIVKQPNQQTYHAAHLPLRYPDGTLTLKGGDDDGQKANSLRALLKPRIVIEDVEACFRGTVWISSPFSANEPNCIFAGPADFNGAIFSNYTSFDLVDFRRDADFRYASFIDGASFSAGEFSGGAAFSGAIFIRETMFLAATFKESADFLSAQFFDYVSFSGSRFSSKLSFSFVKFKRGVSFSDVEFGAENSKVKYSKIDVLNWHSAFNQTEFDGILNFTRVDFGHLAAFDGALINVGIQLDPVREEYAAKIFQNEIIGARDISNNRDVSCEPDQILRDSQLAQLERGCRVLKMEMGKQGDKQREQLFYKFELLARRSQKNLRAGEWIFSYLYEKTSDYHASIVRPLFSLILLLFLLAGILYGWVYLAGLIGNGPLQVNWQKALWQVLDFSWANTLKPLSALTPDSASGKTVVSALFSLEYGIGFAARALATIQSLLVIVLAFLFALAVRRRFQMN